MDKHFILTTLCRATFIFDYRRYLLEVGIGIDLHG